MTTSHTPSPEKNIPLLKGQIKHALSEIADFIYFVRQRVLQPQSFEEERRNALLRVELLQLSQFPHYKEYPMGLDVIHAAAQITDIPELHDCLIAGTARRLNLELITNDPVIQASHFVKTVW